jgi:hypothetical protein
LVELETINLLVQIVGVSAAAIAAVVGVSSYINSNKRAEDSKKKEQETRDRELETRQAQLLMQIFNSISSKEFKKDHMEILWEYKFDNYDEFIKKYGSNESTAKLEHVWGTFEGIGVLLENKLIDPKMLYRVLNWGTILTWEKYGPMLKEWGRRTGEPIMYPGFEFLYKELSKMYEAEHGYAYGHKVRSYDDALASLNLKDGAVH